MELSETTRKRLEKLGWHPERYTYESVAEYARTKEHMYICPLPYKVDGWKTWIIYTRKTHPEDGKLIMVEIVKRAKSYEEALRRGADEIVKLLYQSHLQLWREVLQKTQ